MSSSDVVLVATDLSDSADEAIRQGDRFARLSGGKLVVCHVVHEALRSSPMFPQLVGQDMEAVIHAESRAAADVEDRVVALTGRAAGEFEVRIESGAADAEILRIAEDVCATLIVTASRGLTGIARLLLGNVAERVVRYAHCPVLVARPHEATNKVLVATDLSDASMPALVFGAGVAKAAGSSLTALHCLDIRPAPAFGITVPFGGVPIVPPPELIQQMQKSAGEVLAGSLDRLGIQGEHRVVDGEAASSILRVADELGVDLLVVATHGRTGISRMALGSVAEKVVRGAHCSVLVVRSHGSG